MPGGVERQSRPSISPRTTLCRRPRMLREGESGAVVGSASSGGRGPVFRGADCSGACVLQAIQCAPGYAIAWGNLACVYR